MREECQEKLKRSLPFFFIPAFLHNWPHGCINFLLKFVRPRKS